jgi:hypothetical protein
MNLVLGLLVTGLSGALVWSGISDPEGGTWAGLGRLLRGETQPDKANAASFTATVAAFTSAGASGSGGRGGGTTASPTPAPSTSTGPRTPYALGPVKPHVARAANEIGPMFGITSVGGYRAQGIDPNGHPAGLALDFMVSDARGSALAAYALAKRRRLRVSYVIWRQRINTGAGWKSMADRGSATANHMDHVHVNFTA